MSRLLEQSANLVGIIGVILTLIGYYLLNVGKLRSGDKSYLFLNLFGSFMILFSLLYHWNLASFLIEVAWIFISIIGIYRAYQTTSKRVVI